MEAAIYAASAHVAEDDPASALAVLEESEGRAGEEAALLEVPMARVRASALAALGRFDEAKDRIKEGLTGARDQGLLYEEALLLLAKADVARLAGSKVKTKELEEAQGLLQRLGVVVDA